jgi:hypothetical protein
VKWLALVPLATLAACGVQVDGDQWHQVGVRNDLGRQVIVAGHEVAPGATTTITVNQNTGSGAYGVSDAVGKQLGCLPVGTDTRVDVSALPRCPGGIR